MKKAYAIYGVSSSEWIYTFRGYAEGEEREKNKEWVFKETMAENFINLGRDVESQVHEASVLQKGVNEIRKKWV